MQQIVFIRHHLVEQKPVPSPKLHQFMEAMELALVVLQLQAEAPAIPITLFMEQMAIFKSAMLENNNRSLL